MRSILFDKVKLGKFTLRNRIFMSAAAAYDATPQGDIKYNFPIVHFEISKGGCAMIPTGGISGIHPRGRTNGTRPILDCDERIPSYIKFADNIHKGGAIALAQLTHGGAGAAHYQVSIGNKPFVASYYLKDPKGTFESNNREYCEATEEEIIETINAYSDSALRAKKAGFDGIQIHASHDSLLAQWFSPIYNKRSDSWGISVENRCRMHCLILEDIKRKAGNDFLTVIKLGIEDSYPGGAKADEGIKAADIIASQGYADIIEVSQGLQDISDMNKTSLKPGINSIDKEAYYRNWTKKIKSIVKDKTLITMQGGLRTPSLMEEVIENGEADFVSMCRPYIKEPGIINRWKNGDMSKSTCTSCNQCVINHVFKNQPLKCVLSIF